MSLNLEGSWIRVGEFFISVEKDELWITKQDGEGAEINPEAFEEVIRTFYKENF